MPEQLNAAVTIHARFTTSGGTPYAPTPAPTCTVRLLTPTTDTALVTDAATTPLAASLTSAYTLASGSNIAAGTLEFAFTTADAAADDATLYAHVKVGQTWLERIDAAVSSVGASTSAIADAVWNRFTSAITTAGSIGKLIVDKLGLINAGIINVSSALNAATGTLTIRVGDSYTDNTANGRITIPNTVSGLLLTAATDVRLVIKAAAEINNPNAVAIINVTAHVASLVDTAAEFEISATDTAKLTAGGAYRWFASCLQSTELTTWASGTVTAEPKGR